MKGKQGKFSTPEDRARYMHEYYLKHKEKARKYQRLYHRAHSEEINAKRRQKRRLENTQPIKREPYKATYHASDIMHMTAEKSIRVIEQILSGERGFKI